MLSFTEKAVEYSISVLGPGESIRVGVVGGGCSGMTYALEFETEIDEEDIRLDHTGVDIYVDPNSFEILKDTTVDYVKTLQRQGFVFMNPNANTTCGCGSSFS
jgi:iron-sulfur cluster assembly accessory protein